MEFSYSENHNNDVINLFKLWLDKGTAVLKEDGLIELQTENKHDIPWYHVRPDVSRQCSVWVDVIHRIINVIPTRCHTCWKVVVRPRTLKELFQLVDLQEDCEYFCKCGLERRDFVHGNYGGYFYFNSMSEGFDGLDDIRARVASEISPDVPVFLKRGCTEYELKFPDSENWAVNPDQKGIEDYILSQITLSNLYAGQSKNEVLSVMRRWVEFAYGRGDTTALEFNGGKPLFPPYKIYERPSQ